MSGHAPDQIQIRQIERRDLECWHAKFGELLDRIRVTRRAQKRDVSRVCVLDQNFMPAAINFQRLNEVVS